MDVDLPEVVGVAFSPLRKTCFDHRLEETISPKAIAEGFPRLPIGEADRSWTWFA